MLLQQTLGLLSLIWATMHLQCWPIIEKKERTVFLYFHQQKQQAKFTHHLFCPEAATLSCHGIDKGQIDLSEAGVPAANELKEHEDRHLPQALPARVSSQNSLSDPSVLHLSICSHPLALQSLVRSSQSTFIPLKAALQLALDTETHQGSAVIRCGFVRTERVEAQVCWTPCS